MSTTASTIQIKHWLNGKLLYEGEGAIRAVLEAAVASDADLRGAVLSGADLRGADLRGADLRDAVLRGADLSDADLRDAVLRGADLRDADLRGAVLRDAVLSDGATFHRYATETVPALLTAGGKALADFEAHWECHDWRNCPMAYAFGVSALHEIPLLYQTRAAEFIQFYDARLLPWALVSGGASTPLATKGR